MVEHTEVCGPLVLNLYASTSDTDVLWFVTLFQEDRQGKKRFSPWMAERVAAAH